jgi:hypothetical protein
VGQQLRKSAPGTCYFFDASRGGVAVAHATRRLVRCTVAPLNFRLHAIRDEQGRFIAAWMTCQDVAEVQAEIAREPRFQEAVHAAQTDMYLAAYLRKVLVVTDISGFSPCRRALATVRVCAWALGQRRSLASSGVLFMTRRPWIGAFRRYAQRWGIELIAAPGSVIARSWVLGCLHPWCVEMARFVRAGCSPHGVRHVLSACRGGLWRRPRQTAQVQVRPGTSDTPRLAVECWGHLNLSRPECYSDLFFLMQPVIRTEDALVVFGTTRYPLLDERAAAELAVHGLSGIALSVYGAAAGMPVFVRRPRLRDHETTRRPSLTSVMSHEGRWLRHQLGRYSASRAFWAELCRTHRIKVHVSWYRYDPSHDAVAQAMRDVRGASVIYQRSYQEFPLVEGAAMADVMFGFSPRDADVEARSGSIIPYYVTTGYLGDHRFALLRPQAEDVRRRLCSHGASRVLAYFDENSADDARWGSGHGLTRENYAFFLEKVLTEPWFGLVLKPKVPGTLRRRLGSVSTLLEQALRTGRCVLYETGALHGAYPPAAAALAADIAVHGHLLAETAGIEAALAGVPTLLLDREGWPQSALYQLGVGRVVFNDWPSLWRAPGATR